jgi:hypothetical protein
VASVYTGHVVDAELGAGRMHLAPMRDQSGVLGVGVTGQAVGGLNFSEAAERVMAAARPGERADEHSPGAPRYFFGILSNTLSAGLKREAGDERVGDSQWTSRGAEAAEERHRAGEVPRRGMAPEEHGIGGLVAVGSRITK